MNHEFYQQLRQQSLNGEVINRDKCKRILSDPNIELLPLLDSAYQVRKTHKGNSITLHILNNTQNGFCPEDCNYCAQAKSSKAAIEEYPLKSEEECMAEAKKAYESGAFRYCMVSSGRGPSKKRVAQLAQLIRKIKSTYPLQICVSAGLMGEEAAQTLKKAGLDRLNHNLNTSRSYYPSICSTHTYQDRINTLKFAQKANLEICSGLIVGMGETHDDLVDVALELREFEAPSIPVNFLLPIEGNLLKQATPIPPQFCLRTLCLFRLLNPKAELRIAAGREGHLRGLEVMSFYPADSLFLNGYLNTKGSPARKTLQMISDAGFDIVSDFDLDKLLGNDSLDPVFSVDDSTQIMKTWEDLKPLQANKSSV